VYFDVIFGGVDSEVINVIDLAALRYQFHMMNFVRDSLADCIS